MDAYALDWLNLALRWFHIIAGISWIGSSFYFMWLDSALEPPKLAKKDVEGELWMVHSGGFYQVEKRLIGPGSMPDTLHWFKWEAALTWMSGILLLGVVYYFSGGIYLIKQDSDLSQTQAVLYSVGLLIASWVVYDSLWKTKFVQERLLVGRMVSAALMLGLAITLTKLFSGRAAFIHVGAVFGTLMVANVWMRILPAQQQMIDATKAGRTPNYDLGKRAKKRSVHNSYMTLPVIFLMISNHFPITYGQESNWLVLSLFIVLGMGIRHVMIERTAKRPGWVGLVAAIISFVTLFGIMLPRSTATANVNIDHSVPFSEIQQVVHSRCLSCHSQNPTDDIFRIAPVGITFDTPEEIVQHAERIRVRVVDSKTMPLGNKTHMTDEERELVRVWVESGARIN